jgi:hypothetical protein
MARPRLGPQPAALRLPASGELQPFLGMRPSAPCGLMSAVSRSTLICGIVISPGQLVPLGMLFSERRACLKRLGRSAQDLMTGGQRSPVYACLRVRQRLLNVRKLPAPSRQ